METGGEMDGCWMGGWAGRWKIKKKGCFLKLKSHFVVVN